MNCSTAVDNFFFIQKKNLGGGGSGPNHQLNYNNVCRAAPGQTRGSLDCISKYIRYEGTNLAIDC